jgi:hypothetical protein
LRTLRYKKVEIIKKVKIKVFFIILFGVSSFTLFKVTRKVAGDDMKASLVTFHVTRGFPSSGVVVGCIDPCCRHRLQILNNLETKFFKFQKKFHQIPLLNSPS